MTRDPVDLAREAANTNRIIADLRKELSYRYFPTIESYRAYIDIFLGERPDRYAVHACGLSPDQAHSFLYAPFDSPGLIGWQNDPDKSLCGGTPMLSLFLMLAEGLGERGLKPTARGRLPRALCRELAAQYRPRFFHADDIWFGPISSETDFIELHILHIVGELAGYIRRYNKRIILSRKCRQMIREGRAGELYFGLLHAFITRFNWVYWDTYPEVPLVQQGFMFILYLLKLHGDEYRSVQFHADAFLQAFPDLIRDLPEPGLYDRNHLDQFIKLYEMRCLRNFASFTGLAELGFEHERRPGQFQQFIVTVRKSPLLDAVLRCKSLGEFQE